MSLRFGYATPEREQQLREVIAHLPETHAIIERWEDTWYVMGGYFLPAPWVMLAKMLDIQPLPGFYCVRMRLKEVNLWELGQTVDHVKLWVFSGEIAQPPGGDKNLDPEVLEDITQMLKRYLES